MLKKILIGLGVAIVTLVLGVVITFMSLSSTPSDADITKEMHDPELQDYHRMGRFIANMMTSETGVNFAQSSGIDPLVGTNIPGYHNEERYIKSSEGHKIRVRIFKPENVTEKLPAMLYTHGGGYLTGNPESALALIEDFMETRRIAVIAPAYRLSMEHPFPAGFNDCYKTLLWMKENAEELGIYDDHYVIAGRSAGGGMAAALTLKAHDTKDVNIAFQMPIFPMIDHRQNTKSAQETGAIVWDNESNKHGWYQYLKGLEGKEVPVFASPALRKDFSGLPPAITYVGTLEPFRDETINYVESLKKAGVPTKFQLFEGAYHGFNNLSPEAEISKRADKFQFDAFGEFYDKYVIPAVQKGTKFSSQTDSVETESLLK